MTNKSMGRSQMNECPHKTVSRFYDSAEVSLWRCDWCGQEFRAVDGDSKMVELKEVGTANPKESAICTHQSVAASGGRCSDCGIFVEFHNSFSGPKFAKKREKSA